MTNPEIEMTTADLARWCYPRLEVNRPGSTAGRSCERMETGKFKVFSSLLDWFEEFRLFHRKDGKVVKEGDDLLAATRYGY